MVNFSLSTSNSKLIINKAHFRFVCFSIMLSNYASQFLFGAKLSKCPLTTLYGNFSFLQIYKALAISSCPKSTGIKSTPSIWASDEGVKHLPR